MSAFQSDMNTLQLLNFNRESGWNEIEANLLGATGIFNGDTPVSFIKHSLDTYRHSFSFQEPVQDNSQIGKTSRPGKRICADKTGRVIDCNSPERVEGGNSGGSNNPIFGDNPIYRKETICVDADGNVVPKGTPNAQCSEVSIRDSGITDAIKGQFELFPGFKINGTSVALVVLGIGLIIVAVISLR